MSELIKLLEDDIKEILSEILDLYIQYEYYCKVYRKYWEDGGMVEEYSGRIHTLYLPYGIKPSACGKWGHTMVPESIKEIGLYKYRCGKYLPL